ncbi:MAG: hypothetical protein ACLGHT_05325 [Acidimicrobiia bacterium]
MDVVNQPKSEALRALYWRSEILQVMFWLHGEGFGDAVDPQLLERFLGVDATVGVHYLDRLVEDGFVLRDGDRYALSETGKREGGLEFVASFSELTRPTHGECSADCWCHSSPDEADACAAERRRDHDHEGHR